LRTIEGVDVYRRDEFSRNTRWYWITQTGIGVGFGLTAVLGFLVGAVIVGQTIYASTLEHLREYGTLKALGARNRDLLVVILAQAGLNGLVGYVLGVGLAFAGRGLYERLGLNLVTSPLLMAAMFAVTLVMCLIAAVLPARKAFNVDPVSVFRT